MKASKGYEDKYKEAYTKTSAGGGHADYAKTEKAAVVKTEPKMAAYHLAWGKYK